MLSKILLIVFMLGMSRGHVLPQEDASTGVSPRDGCSIPLSSLTGNRPLYGSYVSIKVANGTSGNLDFEVGEKLTVSCMGNELVSSTSSERPEIAELYCAGGSTFTSVDWFPYEFQLTDVFCSCESRSVEDRITSCGTGLTELWLEVPSATGGAYPVVTVCFRQADATTVYTQHAMLPEHLVTQTLQQEPNVQQGALFPDLHLETLYGFSSQRAALELTLGGGMSAPYLKDGHSLIRGQLTGRSNFIHLQQQRASYFYSNVVPMWDQVQTGNWAALEKSLQKRVAENGGWGWAYAGTHGVLELKDHLGIYQPIYLNITSKKVPVPQYTYKIMSEYGTGRATAFVMINNPYITQQEAEAMTFCTDFCGGSTVFRWVEWDYANTTAGYSFCCEVKEFMKTVTTSPALDPTSLYT